MISSKYIQIPSEYQCIDQYEQYLIYIDDILIYCTYLYISILSIYTDDMLMIYYSVTDITSIAHDGQVQEILQQFRSLRGSLGDAFK